MPRGHYANPRRKVTATAEEFERWDAVAKAAGITWSDWVLGLMRAAAPPPTERTSENRPKSTDARLR